MGISSAKSSNLLSVKSSATSAPIWVTAPGHIGNIHEKSRGIKSFTLLATDPNNLSIIYTITQGSLPSGMSLSTNGIISGTPNSVGSDTEFNFTVSAHNGINFSTRAFSITQKSILRATFTAVGTTSWSAPSEVERVSFLCVAGGGGGGLCMGGGGGAGGLIYNASYEVTPGNSYTVTVGTGGGGSYSRSSTGGSGTNSVFGSFIAYGGGGAASWDTGAVGGGSGGGAPGQGGRAGGGAVAGQGHAGHGTHGSCGSYGRGGGGGGAGASSPNGHNGGIGLAYDISGTNTYYAGGGGGGSNGCGSSGGAGGGGYGTSNSTQGGPGGTNTGGGGGGGGHSGDGPGGPGGSGIVIVAY